MPENASALGKQKEKGLKIYTPYDDDYEIYVEESDEKKDEKKEETKKDENPEETKGK